MSCPGEDKTAKSVNGVAHDDGESTARRGRDAAPVQLDNIAGHLCDRVRQLRKKKGWTLEQLSAACGVSRSMLSQIERNEANPTLAVAYRIAQSFGMSLGNLVDIPDATTAIDIVRSDDRTYHYRSGKDVKIRTLSPPHVETDVEFYEVSLRPGAKLKSAPHFGGVREFLTVENGMVKVIANTDEAVLNQGDSAHYPADVPHAIENIGKTEATVVLVEIYRGKA